MSIPYVKIINNILDSWEDVISGKTKPSPIHALTGKLQFRTTRHTETYNDHDIFVTVKTPVHLVMKKNKDGMLTLSIGSDKIVLSNLSEEEFFQKSTVIDMKDFTYASLVQITERYTDIQERLKPVLQAEEEAWQESMAKLQQSLKESLHSMSDSLMSVGRTLSGTTFKFFKDRK